MSASPAGSESLKHNESAVLKHMEMYQDIITRMANNSAACKKWCVPLITAILAFVVKDKLISLVWLTIVPIIIFYLLDAYYLKLENQFREGFNASAEKIRDGTFSSDDLFNLKPEGSECKFWLKSIGSLSTWPVYIGMFGLLILAYKISPGVCS